MIHHTKQLLGVFKFFHQKHGDVKLRLFSRKINPIIHFYLILFLTPTCYLHGEKINENNEIGELNQFFRSQYAQTRTALLKQSGPIIIVRGDNMILIDGDRRIEGKTIDSAYHNLKAVAHAPIALYSLIVRNKEGSISKETISELQKFIKILKNTSVAFDSSFNSKKVEREQKKILSSCISFASNALTHDKLNHSDLIQFVRGLSKPIQKNLELAAKYRIENYRNQIFQWRDELDEKEWSKLVFLVPGSPMARENNLAVQFCAKFLGEKGEGRRIVYAESMFDETAALLKLATHLFDTQIGKDVFADPWRMHQDALGPASARYLDTISLEFN